ncbi:MAG: transglutaminase-like cysteine peptidase [Methylobacter sp.]|nr:transglutaminase-like cysteine peptidase [Methylobacter sp.]MDP2429750.1 transglutaminase-like cysteine peptidase [Methylobacter sp.]MDP3055618.1 transglutaminase-like cysteine peptidase [Methylobacter sp.]MDP3362453.1 transglutaminase-like cysteine peptidase [Methylobacter sp.]MDZ4220933.1 transglutaminase-like cysteine peptidase [Methylobacter sp.]
MFSRGFRILLLLLGFALSIVTAAQINISAELLAKVEKKYGVAGRIRVEEWRQLLDSQAAKNLPEKEKLKKVNDFFNQRIDFVDDIVLWKVNDYWATPIEFLAQGAGDCEDYAIAKYFTLKALGVPEEKIRITYVKALELNQAHMVLTYFETPRSVPVVLDNLIPQIKPASQRSDLLPVYSFNGSGLWLAKARGSGQRVGGTERLSLWTDLTQRMMRDAL